MQALVLRLERACPFFQLTFVSYHCCEPGNPHRQLLPMLRKNLAYWMRDALTLSFPKKHWLLHNSLDQDFPRVLSPKNKQQNNQVKVDALCWLYVNAMRPVIWALKHDAFFHRLNW